MTSDDEHLTRPQRRQRTDAAILRAARQLFAETGFERTTIRAVASGAGVDPALVMQHYGSKEGLFAAAARWGDDHQRILTATSDNLPAAGLDDLLDQFEGGGGEASVALMRNCLTHPGAAKVMRDEVMCEKAQAVEAALEGPDAELRAALFGACMMGLSLARYLIELPGLVGASREDLHRVMEPALRALVHPPAADPPAADPPADGPGGPAAPTD